MDWLDSIKWDRDGLVPAIAQERGSGDVLMVAHMNRESLARTARLGQAVYWSRSRQQLWHKGERSGHFQQVHEIRLDCDGDVLLLSVTQLGHPDKLVYEVADLWFHSMIALAAFGLKPADVLAELARREGLSGLEEFALRKAQQRDAKEGS
ncbi:MAG: phosphoribosyl-AMP cyclohydrolase [Burkholderiales bacterium]|nr:phosphoribosyl-AMP cyclohydrolase [Burkholderiales bacterium]